jgi:hypothetical protein
MHTQKNVAVSKVNRKFNSHIIRAHRTSAAATIQVSHALIAILQCVCVYSLSHNTHPHGKEILPRLGVACPFNGLQCMHYPFTKFLEGHGQWWYVNAVFNKPPKKISHGVKSGERCGQRIIRLSPFTARPIHRRWRTRLRSTRTFLWTWEEHLPDVKNNRHNLCSVAPFLCVYPVYIAIISPIILYWCEIGHLT